MDKVPIRKNIRLKHYDYSQAGYYFVTICTNKRMNLFWNMKCRGDLWSPEIGIKEMPLSHIGKIVDAEINRINSFYENVEINKYVVMPNHIHMIIVLYNENGRSKTAPTISRIVQQFKGSISKQVGFSLWQKSFYDHIIRNEREYQEIWQYIDTNPKRWEEDEYYIEPFVICT